MAWLRRVRPQLSPTDRDRVGLSKGDELLALLELPQVQARLLVTTHHVVLLPDAGTPVARPWHLVDRAGWARDEAALTISWVDDLTTWRLTITDPEPRALQALRERVQASVVAHEDVSAGARGSVRVVVRQDLATRELLLQTLYARGARPQDPGVRDAVARADRALRDAVGLPPADAPLDNRLDSPLDSPSDRHPGSPSDAPVDRAAGGTVHG
ncbi:hypothetical protein [Arsenicicoccus sp. oral taxon 190]|uniref:hypothetical protein n=1 Tax=Arsenicicoccus sp. oral taxon 190 TaxID=1658671 RepID=UPI00067B3B1F|nr:hypothetical protein [Arsenicicoccus sp. oral taxon 190]